MVRLHVIEAETPPRSASAEQIKAVARRLFAERGVDGVTVREIAAAAGQKNHGAVGYYFGSKEALVRAIVIDGAAAVDRRRNARLDEIEAAGGPRSLREVVEVLVYPAVAGGPDEDFYISFITMLSMTHRELMMRALDDRWNSAYLRCLEQLRRLMPPMATALKNQRFVFMGAYLSSVLALRERALSDLTRAHPTWGSERTLEHFVLTLTAMLEAPGEATDAAQTPAGGGEYSGLGMVV